MPKYMVILARDGFGEAKFFNSKILAEEYFTDIWTGYNDWEHVRLYVFVGGEYVLLRNVVKGDCL